MILFYPEPLAGGRQPGRTRRLLMALVATVLVAVVAVGAAWSPSVAAAARNSLTILGASASSLDPAVQSDAGSAQVVTQVYESLTAIDTSLKVQPALAASWETQDGGKKVVFHLRANLTFSNGAPLTASNVVSSWTRVLNPKQPSQLASLLDDVVGARAYREGKGQASAVGIKAVGSGDVEVALVSPAADFASIASSPTLAVVPSDIDSNPGVLEAGSFVGSGAYVVSSLTDTETTLSANSHYWAVAMGIDWRRIVALQSNPLESPATGMVPLGVPGHSTTDYGPKFDLATAKSELAAAGFPNGTGFPKVTLTTTGVALDAAILMQLHDNLGIDIGYQTMDWPTYNARLLSDPPAMWQMGWVADYPGANDFLGLLLGSGTTNNFGRWSSTDFDAAVQGALAATDATAMQRSFDQAQAVVADQVPVIPVDYGAGYALAATGLLGASPNGQGLVRYAGLAWSN